jgi:hypothetical protein
MIKNNHRFQMINKKNTGQWWLLAADDVGHSVGEPKVVFLEDVDLSIEIVDVQEKYSIIQFQ